MKEKDFFETLQSDIRIRRAVCKKQRECHDSKADARADGTAYAFGFNEGVLVGLRLARVDYFAADGKDFGNTAKDPDADSTKNI
ncbi:MAG: hypothetical protein PUF17_07325 [Lactimicrobium massiliense]|nr:hypothetical protein [Lactimicrobium massiliense]MDD6560766.1 hypothetical protein [Lactimicrobium massiliense]